jgi:hypothetical protein
VRQHGALVFVPSLGFRPAGTRVLLESAHDERSRTRLHAVALAASTDATDVMVEWERPESAGECAPGPYLAATPRQPPDLETAHLTFGTTSLPATTIACGSFSVGAYGTHAFHTLRFPSIPADRSSVELRVREGDDEFALSLRVTTAAISAHAFDASASHAGVTVRAIGAAWHGGDLIVGLEVTGTSSVNQVGAPMPQQPQFRGVSSDVRRERAKELRRVFGDRVDPIRLEFPDGTVLEESRRIFAVRPVEPHPAQRFAVAFPKPVNAKEATLVVPFVELSDRGSSAEVDLRALPATVRLGSRAFTVVSAEPYGDETKVNLQLRSGEEDEFVQPASFVASGGSYSWAREGQGRVWFAGRVGDPPIVRFIGTVSRVRGPWRVPLPLVE